MQGLDPWTQWVNIHTGKPQKIINCFKLENPEIKISTNMGPLSKKKFQVEYGGNEF